MPSLPEHMWMRPAELDVCWLVFYVLRQNWTGTCEVPLVCHERLALTAQSFIGPVVEYNTDQN